MYNQYHGFFQLVVVPGLFLGDLDDATDVEKLKRTGIKTVVSLCDYPLPLPLLLRTGTITSLGLEAYKNMIFNYFFFVRELPPLRLKSNFHQS